MEQIIEIPLRKLRESPVNPRKTFNEASLRELAETMMPPHGRVHQAIVVRPLAQADIEAEYEIVFGHRRFRAAGLARLEAIPAVVRDMSDKEVAIAQGVENLQREDVSPIEEADNFNLLRHQHGMPIEELMERSGKGRTYVFNALKLATAHDVVRQAVADKIIGGEIAKEIARVPNPLQPKALEAVTEPDYEGDTGARRAMSFRRAKGILQSRFQLSLLAAPFDTLSITLVPGVSACDACPKRSDNELALFEQCGPDVCTDPDCFATKREAHLAQLVAAFRKRGQPVLEGDDAKKIFPSPYTTYPYGYTRLSTPTGLQSLAGVELTYGDLVANLGKKAPKPTLIVNPHHPGAYVECLTEEQAGEVFRASGGHTQGADSDTDDDDEASSPQTPEEQAVADRDHWRAVRREIMARAVAGTRTLEELRLLTKACTLTEPLEDDLLDLLGWREEYDALEWTDRDDWLEARIDAMGADQLALFGVLVAITRHPVNFDYETEKQERIALAKLYSVDVLDPTGAKAAEAASTPSTAAQAPEGAPPKAKKGKKAAPVNHELPLDEPAQPAGEEGKEVKDDAGSAGELTADEVSA